MRELQKKYSFNFGISTTIFSMNLDDAENILAWSRREKLDIDESELAVLLLYTNPNAKASFRFWYELDDRTAPMAGLVATFVFAAQMLNFPVVGGTSGHLMGGALAAILAGATFEVVEILWLAPAFGA